MLWWLLDQIFFFFKSTLFMPYIRFNFLTCGIISRDFLIGLIHDKLPIAISNEGCFWPVIHDEVQ